MASKLLNIFDMKPRFEMASMTPRQGANEIYPES